MNTFNIPTAKNVNEARRQANCFTRAQQMDEQGYTFEVNTALQSGVCYFVTNPDGTTYTVDPLTAKCTCPDFAKHEDYCKHMMFCNIMIENREAADEADAARYEAEYGACELETTGCDPYAKF